MSDVRYVRCSAELTPCLIVSSLTERAGTHRGPPQQTPNKGLHKGQHCVFSHTAAKKRGPTFCLHPPFPTHIRTLGRLDVGGYCCRELFSPLPLSLLIRCLIFRVLCFSLMSPRRTERSSSSPRAQLEIVKCVYRLYSDTLFMSSMADFPSFCFFFINL